MADNKCDYCGKQELLPFSCKYCGGTFCASHRLPEYHECIGLPALKGNRFNNVAPSRRQPAAKRSRGFSLPKVRLPAHGYYAYILIGITVLAFIAQNFIPGFTEALIANGNTILTKPWTLVTYMFLHSGLFHILFNMLGLFFFGPLLERQIGSGKFLGLYIGSGIIAAIAQVLLFPSSLLLGASGAVFGILGALTILMPNMRIFVYFIPMKLVYAVILFAALDLVMMGSGDNIAHAAHLVGLLVGLVFGYLLKKSKGRVETYWHA